MKKIILLLIFLLILVGCQKKQLEDIYVLYTNDVHCNLDGDMNYANLAAYKKQLQEEHKYVVLVDNGDYTQGKPIGGLTKGSALIDIMNKVPYDIATIGNHEFDYGIEVLKENLEKADFDIVLSNVIYSGNKTSAFENTKPYVIKDFDGIKVAFIGVTTPWSISSSTPSTFMEDGEYVYDFGAKDGENSLINIIQKNVDSSRKEGAKYVILMAHLGNGETYKPFNSENIIANTKGVDVVLDAHEHAEILAEKYNNLEGKEVLLTSTGTGLNNIGELIIKTDGTFETVLVSTLEEKDLEVQSFIDSKTSEFDEYLNTVIGHTDFDLSINDNGIRVVRSRETNIGNLVADAYKWYFNADIGIANGGGVRNTIEAGDVTLGNCLSVVPFSNELSFVKISGQMLADALEFTSRETENIIGVDGKAIGESGGFLQVSGIKYTIDTSKSADIDVDENGMLLSISGDRRISDLMILENGKYVPVEMDKEYTLAGTDYVIKQHGDGMTAFDDSEYIVNCGAMDVDVFASYIEDQLKGIIPENYKNLENRITVK